MYSITLRHGLFLMVILHVARCAYVTQRTLQNSGQFMRSLEVSATDNVEENIPEYAMLSLSRIVVANQLLFAYNWMSFQCTCKMNDLTSKQGSEISPAAIIRNAKIWNIILLVAFFRTFSSNLDLEYPAVSEEKCLNNQLPLPLPLISWEFRHF